MNASNSKRMSNTIQYNLITILSWKSNIGNSRYLKKNWMKVFLVFEVYEFSILNFYDIQVKSSYHINSNYRILHTDSIVKNDVRH